MDDLLTFEQLQELLNMSRRQLRYFIATRHIPYVKITRNKRLVDRKHIQKYISNNIYVVSG